jgi:hypothetical protein
MEALVGLNAKLYYGAAESDPSTELSIVGNVKMPISLSEAVLKIRASNFELTKVVLYQASIDFDILWDETDANFTAIWSAFTSQTPKAFKCLPKTGGKGLKADFQIVKFERTEDLEGIVMASVSIKPTVGQTPTFV